MSELPFHPLANIFPLMDGSDFRELVEDIRSHGLREPVVIHEGAVLDGRNRQRACAAAQVPIRYEPFSGSDPVAFVISMNLRRRHLNESQRAMVAQKLANLAHGQRADLAGREANLPLLPSANTTFPVTTSEAAELLNVSERSVRSARAVAEHGIPELNQKVERDEVSVSAAAEIATLPKDEQKEIVARGEKEIIAKANAIKREKKAAAQAEREADIRQAAASVPAAAERYDLRHAEFTEAEQLGVGSVDIIVTDPPYPGEYLHVFSGLSQVAARTLKPGGVALVMVGQTYLTEIIRRLDEHLDYHWTLAYLTPGGQAVQQFQRKVNAFWKPVLVYTNGEYIGDWFADVSRSDTNDNDKDHHHWGQSVSGMRDLMKRFVRPGQTVLDPFLGGGTTAVVALELGAYFIGYDIDPKAIDATKARIGGIHASLVA